MTSRTRITAALAAALTAGVLAGASPAQATCYVDVDRPVGLGVCASVKRDPAYGLCIHVAVYTDQPNDPDPLICTGI